MPVVEALKTAQLASQYTDRVLFVAVLLIFGLFGWLVIKWLSKQHALVTKDYKEAVSRFDMSTNKYYESLIDLVQEGATRSTELKVALSENTEVIKKNTTVLEQSNIQRLISDIKK